MPKRKKKKGQRIDDMDDMGYPYDAQLPYLIELNPGTSTALSCNQISSLTVQLACVPGKVG